MITDTYLGDYPHWVGGDRGLAGWMLLSYKKPASASSTQDTHDSALAFDEDVRTWWSAKTGDADKWLQVDLGAPKRLFAVQVNFADEGSTALGRLPPGEGYGYRLEVSADAKTWRPAIDRQVLRDGPHDYTVLPEPITLRYARLVNTHVPGGAHFSVSGLRLFGLGSGSRPSAPSGLTAQRDATDPRHATFQWQPVPGADFYIVRLGTRRDRLTMNYQVQDGTAVDVRSLTAGVPYFATVDAVNDRGIGKGSRLVAF